MNKEIELLKKILATGWLNNELSCEVQELLAQPDINTQYLLDQVSRLTSLNAMLKEKWSEAQPKPTAEPVAWMWDEMFCEDWTTVSSVIKPIKCKYVDNVRPLYLAPTLKTNRVFYQEGYAQAELDLKREPLSDLRIRAANCNEYFEWGVRFAEKAHGIGGGE